jgi:hypothetical protein
MLISILNCNLQLIIRGYLFISIWRTYIRGLEIAELKEEDMPMV